MNRDQKLIAYLDAKFENIDAKFEAIDTRFEAIDTRLEVHDTRFEAIDTKLEVHNTKFENIDTKLGDNQEQIRENRKQIHYTQLLGEDLRSKVQLLAEGHATLAQKIDRNHQEARAWRLEDRAYFEAMFVRLSRRDDQLEERIERLEMA